MFGKTVLETIWSCCCLLYPFYIFNICDICRFLKKVSGIDEITFVPHGTCQLHFLNINNAHEPFRPPLFQYVALSWWPHHHGASQVVVVSMTVCHSDNFLNGSCQLHLLCSKNSDTLLKSNMSYTCQILTFKFSRQNGAHRGSDNK